MTLIILAESRGESQKEGNEVKQTIEFSLVEDTAYDVALAVAAAYGYSSVEELVELAELAEPADAADAANGGDDEETPVGVLPGGWNKNKMRRYAKALQPNAQHILRVIAEHAPSVDVETVQEKSGLDGYVYAGSMSSFGFAARNVHGVKDKPFVKVAKHYEIDLSVAALVLEVLDEK